MDGIIACCLAATAHAERDEVRRDDAALYGSSGVDLAIAPLRAVHRAATLLHEFIYEIRQRRLDQVQQGYTAKASKDHPQLMVEVVGSAK